MVAICRLCASLKKSETMMLIKGKDHDLYKKLIKCFQISIDLNNVLPRGVCPECVRNLNVSFEFYERIHESQHSLEKLLNVPRSKKTKQITMVEEVNLAVENKSPNLVTVATATVVVEPGEEMPKIVENTDHTTTLGRPSRINRDDLDQAVVWADFQLKKQHSTQASTIKKDKCAKDDVKTNKIETYEVVICGEEITDSNSQEILSSSENDILTAIEYIEDENDLNVDNEEYEIVQEEEVNQSSIEEDDRRNVNDLQSTDLNYADTECLDYSPPSCNPTNNSTWFDYPWKCVNCSQTFQTGQELLDHYELVEQILPVWFCADCLKVFSRYYSLINHIRQRHRKHLAKLCDICNQNCESFKELDHHRQIKHNIEYFNMLLCQTCGKGFNNTNSLQIHNKCHLPDDMRLLFSCNLCDKNFKSSSNLKFHQKMHAGLKDYVCDQCGKKFVQRANLEEHLVTHIDFTPYECDLCQQSFKTSERLTKHKKRHTDEKPFRCSISSCNKTFRTKDAMASHSRIHTGEMPFQCEFCQKPFRFKSTLMTHHNVHTGIRPYSCIDCDHHFTNWPNYNKHMKRRHGLDLSSKNPRGKKPSQPKINVRTKKSNSDDLKQTKDTQIDSDNDEGLHEEVKSEELEDVMGEYAIDNIIIYESKDVIENPGDN